MVTSLLVYLKILLQLIFSRNKDITFNYSIMMIWWSYSTSFIAIKHKSCSKYTDRYWISVLSTVYYGAYYYGISIHQTLYIGRGQTYKYYCNPLLVIASTICWILYARGMFRRNIYFVYIWYWCREILIKHLLTNTNGGERRGWWLAGDGRKID